METIAAVRPIRTEGDYEAALAAIRTYFDNEPEAGSEAADHYDLLALVIESYEDRRYPIPAADPVAAVNLVMETRGLSRADLARVLGGQPRVSEFLNGRRDLTLSQVRRLNADWKIPADALIGAA